MNIQKYISCLVCLLLIGEVSYAQSRKAISQFSHFQSYYNPSLTGYEGSTVRGFVRNQWSGYEGAPKTYFLSTEIDLGELSGVDDPSLMGKNAFSVNLLNDNYGAFRENELIVSYASRVRLSKNLNLRLGIGVNYQNVRLDGNALTAEELNDPTLAQYFGTFSDMRVVDMNIGMALTHKNYYLSYGMHRINGGGISSGDKFMDGYPSEKFIQAGFRENISSNIAVITNANFRSRKDLPNVLELNFKALLMDKVWVGAGHRVDFASNFQFGILANRLRIGYVYEFPVGKEYLLPTSTHEFTVVLNLFGAREKSDDRVAIW
jgi:type IX secretion system PorP/SprF family membrane protein